MWDNINFARINYKIDLNIRIWLGNGKVTNFKVYGSKFRDQITFKQGVLY